jgi:hypothetical protein
MFVNARLAYPKEHLATPERRSHYDHYDKIGHGTAKLPALRQGRTP